MVNNLLLLVLLVAAIVVEQFMLKFVLIAVLILGDMAAMILNRFLSMVFLCPVLIVAVNTVVVMFDRHLLMDMLNLMMATMSVLIWSLLSHVIADHGMSYRGMFMVMMFGPLVVLLSRLIVMTMVI